MSDRAYRFCLINLGCPKNTVDSEGILGRLSLAGFQFVPDPALADVCIVNTCGFLDSARQETAAVLQELRESQTRRGRPLLVATGCLVERAGGAPELAHVLDQADAKVGFADYMRLPKICQALLQAQPDPSRPTQGYAGRVLPRGYFTFLNQPRMRIGSSASAYLKLGEGCSNNCAYCSIPLIRGQRASRSMAAIVKEARQLVAAGAKELNLIAQDTTAYGIDRTGRSQLVPLLKELSRLPGDLWLRLLYAHPRHLTEEILETMAADPRICPYLDLPLQHISDTLLRTMKRGYGRARVETLLEHIQRIVPGVAVRTTLIVGHPGEGKKEFDDLLAFVKAGHFDHLGVFAWSPEPGTVSAKMKSSVDPRVAAERCDRLMRAQARVSARRLRTRRGQSTTMLVERKEADGWHGRTPWQAPDVDGETNLTNAGRSVDVGDIIPVVIAGTDAYDCQAYCLEE